MSQPQFQPQPGQPPQPPGQPPQYNPYAGQPGVPQQPATPPQMPQQPPGPPQMPAQQPGQPPMQPPGQQGWPGQPQQPIPGYPVQPGAQQLKRGNPAGAFFLALLVSFVISLLYTGIRAATWNYQTVVVGVSLYLVYTVLNGAAVGAVAGRVGGNSAGVRVGAVVVGLLGAFFGSTNSIVVTTLVVNGFDDLRWALQANPFFPAAGWWAAGSGYEWVAVVGLVLAAAAAFGLSFAVGKKRG